MGERRRQRAVEQAARAPEMPLWARCPACGHLWAAAYLPVLVRLFATIAKRHSSCPKCGTEGVVARQDNGVLLEQPESADA